MNKFVAVLVVVLALAASQVIAGKGKGHHHSEKHKKNSEDCKAETQATDDDAKSFWRMSEELTTAEAKCYAGCMYEKMGLIVNGAFSTKNADKWIERKLADQPEKQEQAKAGAAECANELEGVPQERCQTGPILRQCFSRLMKKMIKNDKNE